MDSFLCTRGFLDVGDTLGAAVLAKQNFTDHGAGDESEAPGLLSGRDEDLARAEVRSDTAAAPALSAVMAGGAAVERPGKDREPRRDAWNTDFVAGLFENHFAAARFGRRLENAVGRTGYVFLRAEDTDVAFDLIVVGRNIVVGDGPVVTETIARLGTKIHRGET